MERNGNRSRELELALGDGFKKLEVNEKETAILQEIPAAIEIYRLDI